jgi:hypothetical protein
MGTAAVETFAAEVVVVVEMMEAAAETEPEADAWV